MNKKYNDHSTTKFLTTRSSIGMKQALEGYVSRGWEQIGVTIQSKDGNYHAKITRYNGGKNK